MRILINALILFLPLMNLLLNMFRGKRMERQTLWLSKHLAIMLRKNISTFASRCKRKPSFWFWTRRSDRSATAQTGLTGPETSLTGDVAFGSDSAKKDDSIVSAEAQDWRVPLMSYLRYPGRGAERNIRH